MRGLALVALVFVTSACGSDEVVPDAGRRVDAPPPIDGPPADAFSTMCSSADGTATVSTTGGTGGGTAFGRLYAGGLWEIGPVAPLAGPSAPLQIYFVFANADPVERDELACCLADDDACCTINSVVAGTVGLDPGTEVGTHNVTFAKTNGNAFSVPGNVTITTFVHPFNSAPGRVAGSVSASNGGLTVTGTFDNEFCQAFLSATI